jgi:hypothetical protein
MEDKEALSAYGMASRSLRYSRCRCPPGALGPCCGEQRAERTWLPAPLVWIWVRAHRQLHAGNARLRPATTSFPLCFCPVQSVAAFSRNRGCGPPCGLHNAGRSLRCAHTVTRPALTQVVNKKGENCAVDCSTTFPRVSRAAEVRNREDAANTHAIFELRFPEICAVRARRVFLLFRDC